MQLKLLCILSSLKYISRNGMVGSKGMPLNFFKVDFAKLPLRAVIHFEFPTMYFFFEKIHKYDFMHVGLRNRRVMKRAFSWNQVLPLSLWCHCLFPQQLDFQNDWKLINVFFTNTNQCHLCLFTQQVSHGLGSEGPQMPWGVQSQWTKPAWSTAGQSLMHRLQSLDGWMNGRIGTVHRDRCNLPSFLSDEGNWAAEKLSQWSFCTWEESAS